MAAQQKRARGDPDQEDQGGRDGKAGGSESANEREGVKYLAKGQTWKLTVHP